MYWDTVIVEMKMGEKLALIRMVNKVEIYRGWCKKCGICVAFCPRQVLASDDSGYPVVKDISRCTACQLCATRCPDFAITIDGNRKNDEEIEDNDKRDGKTGSAPGK